MVRASVIISSLFAFAACVSAVPAGTLVNVDGGHHIGLNNANLQRAGQELVDARGVVVKDAVQRINVAGHDDADHNHGLLGGLLKREEAPAGTIRIARAAGSKKNKNKNAQAAA